MTSFPQESAGETVFVYTMEFLYSLPFYVLEVPNLKLKKPTWFHQPSPMVVYSLVLFSYFLVCGGIIYDVIVEPPSIGSTVDEHGHSKPVAFMPYRVNGQYIMEGLASSFLFTIGGLGFVILDRTHNPSTPRLNRILLISTGFICILVSFFTCYVFMRIKLPVRVVVMPIFYAAEVLTGWAGARVRRKQAPPANQHFSSRRNGHVL